jgi:hypothetical protein
MTKQQKILLICLVGISFIYYISSCYINTSNDGSHYALVTAIVEKQTTVIDDYISYTGLTDYAVKNGHYYSDRLPGTALLLLPFYTFGSLLEELNLSALSTHMPIQEVTVILMSNLCSVFGVYFLYLLLIEFKFSFRVSLICSILFAFGTLNWQESTHVFSHAASMCFVFASFYYLIKSPSIHHRFYYLFVCLLSYSIILELQNSLLFIPASIYIIAAGKIPHSFFNVRTLKSIFTSLFIITFFLSILIGYNYISFGEIMLKSNKYNPEFPEEISFFTSLSGDFFLGIDRLFINSQNPEVIANFELGVKNDIPGLFVTSPLFIVSLVGFYLYFKKQPKEALLFITIILINIFIAAFHKTVLVRHVFTITPFLFLPIAFVIDTILKHESKIIQFSGTTLLASLSLFSIIRIYYVTHTYWGREISQAFPFIKELPIYFTFIILLGIIAYFIRLSLSKTN